MDKKYFSLLEKYTEKNKNPYLFLSKENLDPLLSDYLKTDGISENILISLFENSKDFLLKEKEILEIENLLANEKIINHFLSDDEVDNVENEEKIKDEFQTAKSIGNTNQSNNNPNKINTDGLNKKIINNTNNKNNEDKDIQRIESEIITSSPSIKWSDIAGLAKTKRIIQEIIVWPMLRPDLFTNLRQPPKGLLLFGPPGTGKTLLGKCIASEIKATFFSITSSSLTSKFVGEGEKNMRILFEMARDRAPSVIFFDEIDSLLSKRNESENESCRKMKTEFLVQFDGIQNKESDNKMVLIIGATNRPQEIDDAARRRLVKRVYVPLPCFDSRLELIKNLLSKYSFNLNEDEFNELSKITQGYSGSDLFNLCREAVMEPLREITDIKSVSVLRPIILTDFKKAMNQIRKSVNEKDLEDYIKWNDEFGSN